MSTNPEGQPVPANHMLMEHARNFGDGLMAKLAIAASLGGGIAVENAVNAEALDNAAPIVTQPTDPNTLRQACADAALRMPQIKEAYVVQPGSKPFEHHPGVLGAVQSTVVKLWYEGMPSECATNYQRIGSGKIQKEIAHNKWATIDSGWAYTRNIAGPVQFGHIDSGHGEPAWEYLKPGEHERIIFTNKIRNLQTGEAIQKIQKIVKPRIRWNT